MPTLERWSIRRARLLMGTKLTLIAALAGLVLLAWMVELVAGLDGPVRLGPLLALGVAAVPAGLWLAFFYLLDRHEPEPKQLVLGMCVLGSLIAAPLADFVQRWAAPPVALEVPGLSPISLDRIVHAVLVVGLAQEVCKYAVVRYSVYLSREFDQPMDGVVYMLACGTGFAVWVNYHTLSRQEHSTVLSIAVAQAAVTTLAHAAFAGALGYVMGRAKFSRRSPLARGTLLLLGLLAAATLNGAYSAITTWLTQSNLAQRPWRGLAYTALAAAAAFGITWLGAQHLLRRAPARGHA
jgi:RsiW-degrading membrane proteinase PrsW (M82 family)